MRTDEATFVVFDTETTGVVARTDRIIEIGAIKLRGTEEVARFSSLVNPERSIPRRITGITGLSAGTLVSAPPAREVIPAFVDFARDAVLVAHNIGFDVEMVNAELARLGLPPLLHPQLCTLRLCRRLLRGLKSKGLTAVADHFGIAVQGRHRALGDAEATAEVLRRLLPRIGARAETVEGLLAFQHTRYGSEAAHLTRLRAFVQTLPERPGVYFMHDAAGAVVYVGKARRLRARVRQYFTAVEAKEPRLKQLADAVRSVTYTETGSELGALLLESRLIKELQPRFNRAARRYRSRPFIRLETTPYPRVSVAGFTLDDGAEYFGPLASRRQAEIVAEVVARFFRLRECDEAGFARGPCLYDDLGRCLAPCRTHDADAYADEVARLRAFLLGQHTGIQDELRAAMGEAATRREYELAATYRDWLAALDRMAGHQRVTAASVLEHHAAVVQDGVEPGTVQVFAIRYGRHTATLTLRLPPAESDLADLDTFLRDQFGVEQAPPERYNRREIDEVRVLAHWLYVHRHSARHVPLASGQAFDAFAARVRAALVAEDDADVPEDEDDPEVVESDEGAGEG
jgi:DNA polymerase III subunit epsilon